MDGRPYRAASPQGLAKGQEKNLTNIEKNNDWLVVQ